MEYAQTINTRFAKHEKEMWEWKNQWRAQPVLEQCNLLTTTEWNEADEMYYLRCERIKHFYEFRQRKNIKNLQE